MDGYASDESWEPPHHDDDECAISQGQSAAPEQMAESPAEQRAENPPEQKAESRSEVVATQPHSLGGLIQSRKLTAHRTFPFESNDSSNQIVSLEAHQVSRIEQVNRKRRQGMHGRQVAFFFFQSEVPSVHSSFISGSQKSSKCSSSKMEFRGWWAGLIAIVPAQFEE
jgi:hypothetical protein